MAGDPLTAMQNSFQQYKIHVCETVYSQVYNNALGRHVCNI